MNAVQRQPTVIPIGVVGERFDRPQPVDECRAAARILVVDEYSMMAEGLQLALAGRGWTVETSSGPSASDVVDLAERFRPHCTLLDVRVEQQFGRGFALIEPLAAAGSHVVMLTSERRRTALAECLEAGAVGWIRKSSALDEVDEALRRLIGGGTLPGHVYRAEMLNELHLARSSRRQTQAIFEQLTEREALVLAALTDGLNAEEIASENYVAVTTVRSQIRAVLQKLGVNSQLAAVAAAGLHRELLPERGAAERDRRRYAAGESETRRHVSASIA